MKLRFISLGLAVLMPIVVLAETPRARMGTMPEPSTPYTQSLADIKSTLGLVPDFFKGFSQEGLPGAWEAFKAVQLSSNTAIPPKYKELIGLAVASQIPCSYCTFFHTESAKLNGASTREIQEAVSLAAIDREWSTIMHGTQADYTAFKKDTDAFVKRVKKQMANGETVSSGVQDLQSIKTADDAYADMKSTLGFVPDFAKNFPTGAIAGAWKELKAVSFTPNTAIPPKYKDLISLAVAAQVPCQYCIYFDTETAKLDGATQDEINEAVAMAASSRHWSTVLNGLQTSEPAFRKQMAQVFGNAKKAAKTNKAT